MGSGSGLTPLSQRSWNDCHKKGFKYKALRQASAAKCVLSECHHMWLISCKAKAALSPYSEIMDSINNVHDVDDIKSPTLPVNTVSASDNLQFYLK